MKRFEHSTSSELAPDELRRELIADIVPALGRWKYNMVSDSDDAIVMQRVYRSGWVIFFAICLLPVGLLLLLIKSTAIVTFTFVEENHGSLVEIGGSGPGALVDWLRNMEL